MKYFIGAAILSFFLVSCSDYGKKLSYGKSELFYTKNVTKEDATKLGDYLKEQRFFIDDEKTISIQLDKLKDTFLFRMVVLDSALNDKNFIANANAFPADLSEHVFDKKPVVFHLCDNRFNVEKVIRP